MKLKPKTVRAGIVLIVSLLVVSLTVWRTLPSKKRKLSNLETAQYMHCPECMAEERFSEEKLEGVCLQCGSDKGFEATTESIKKVSVSSPYAKLFAFVLPELVITLGALWYVLKPRDGDQEVQYRYMRCGFCGQKLRFRVAQVGAMGACSRCKRAFLFPEGTPREHDLDGGAVEDFAENEED